MFLCADIIVFDIILIYKYRTTAVVTFSKEETAQLASPLVRKVGEQNVTNDYMSDMYVS